MNDDKEQWLETEAEFQTVEERTHGGRVYPREGAEPVEPRLNRHQRRSLAKKTQRAHVRRQAGVGV